MTYSFENDSVNLPFLAIGNFNKIFRITIVNLKSLNSLMTKPDEHI